MAVASIVRMTTEWTGFTGAPGYTNFYAATEADVAALAQGMSNEIHAFWSAVNGYIPAAATLTVGPGYQVLSDLTGDITAEGTVGSPAAAVTGNSSAQFAASSGVLLEWLTASYIAGRRLKGRTYLVPFIGAFDTDGTLSAAVSAAIYNLANALWSGAFDMVVWHRPVAGTGGSSSLVTGVRVSDHPATLRSRSR